MKNLFTNYVFEDVRQNEFSDAPSPINMIYVPEYNQLRFEKNCGYVFKLGFEETLLFLGSIIRAIPSFLWETAVINPDTYPLSVWNE